MHVANGRGQRVVLARAVEDVQTLVAREGDAVPKRHNVLSTAMATAMAMVSIMR